MKILTFDTSTQQCSVALSYNDEIRDVSLDAPNQHAELILPLIETLLKEAGLSLAQIDVIGFGRGPGSFTGLRIAASLVQGLACVHDIPVAPISTLQTLAQAAYRNLGAEQAAVAMDARMQQIYWGTFVLNSQKIMTLAGVETVIDPSTATLTTPGWAAIGSGWAAYAETLRVLQPFLSQINASAVPQARTMIPLAQHLKGQNLTISAETALPIYLRDKVC